MHKSLQTVRKSKLKSYDENQHGNRFELIYIKEDCDFDVHSTTIILTLRL